VKEKSVSLRSKPNLYIYHHLAFEADSLTSAKEVKEPKHEEELQAKAKRATSK
jgi:hypothetical protein